MARIRGAILKWFISVSLVLCMTHRSAGEESSEAIRTLPDLEQIKNDFIYINKFAIENLPLNNEDQRCLSELNAIGNGIQHLEFWAMKILDAWGKMPSGILDGNLNDFGAFPECFQIERDNKPYQTKYCLAKLKFNSTIQIVQYYSFTFGLCVPAVCSSQYFEKLLNLAGKKYKNVFIELLDNTCQTEENISELQTIDWVTIGVLAIIAVLILLSTCYDIFYTVYNREKSQALLAFSFYSNGMKLLSYKKSKKSVNSELHCIHGIRAISTGWVVLGHSISFLLQTPVKSPSWIALFLPRYYSVIATAAPISVDTFFCLSGLLASTNILEYLRKTKGRINVPLLYFHRFLRLTPLLAVVILCSITLMKFFGDGPLWTRQMNLQMNKCESNWWQTLLYIQNYNANSETVCLPHSWFLAVDMQLFIAAPLIIYLIYRFDLKAIFFLILLILGSSAWGVVVTVDNRLNGFFFPNHYPNAYSLTHLHCSSYLIGVIAGYIFLKYQNRLMRIPKLFNLFAWALSLLTMFVIVMMEYPLSQLDSTATHIVYGLYDTLSRIFWSIALSFIIFSCVHKSGGPVNWFLAHPLWQPLSRVSYAIYLIHVEVIQTFVFSVKVPSYIGFKEILHNYIGYYVITVFMSIVASLAFESPIITLEKMLFGSYKKRKSSEMCENERTKL